MPSEAMTTDAPTIRYAVPDDLPSILALIDRLTGFGPPAYRDAHAMARTDRAIAEAAVRQPVPDQAAFVATDATGIAGFLHMTTLVDYYTGKSNAHVNSLIVDAAMEGRGVGRRLLAHAEAWARARGDDWVTLTVFPGNARAIGLYERVGFHADMARYLKPLA